jgi:hypothetical protein
VKTSKNHLLFGVLFIAFMILSGCSSADERSIIPLKKLQEDASTINIKAPYMTDKDTLLMKAVARDGEYELHNMLVHIKLDGMSDDGVRGMNEFIRGVLNYISCNIEGIKDYPMRGVALIWQYYDNQNTHFLTHRVNRGVCLLENRRES